ncbi:MAG: DUF1501 domain-containing protein [Planctomycetaceae bacterium]
MLTIEDRVRAVGRLPRRAFLRVGPPGLAALSALGVDHESLAQVLGEKGSMVRDRSVIFLFMHGGPSQFETFDPKQDGPAHARSQTGDVGTSIPGISFGATFEKLAARAHLLSIVRSFVTGDGNQDIKPVVGAATGRANLGSLYARVVGATSPLTGMPSNALLVPQSVNPEAGPAITQFGDFASPGSLGAAYAPLVPGAGGTFERDMRLSLSQTRLDDRRSLLGELDRNRRWLDGRTVDDVDRIRGTAFDALLKGVGDAFDLSGEDAATLARYDTAPHFSPDRIDKAWNNHRHYADHGQSIGRLLLLARRLCERGCGFVTVTTSFVWDMHADINNAPVREGMGYVGAPFDHAVSALIDDIENRGLRDRILLVCCGEMGRTPVINAKGGRDHWGAIAPLLLYGGGLPGGSVIGASTRDGGRPASDPVTIPDLIATVLDAVLELPKVRLLDGLPREILDVIGRGRPIGTMA